MKYETPQPNMETPSLTEFELGLFLNGLKQAAEHSIGAERISQLRGFQGLSEKDQAIVSQRADQQRADLALRRLEDEWRRLSFDQLIAPKLQSASGLNLGRKYDADDVYQSVLSLASERKWETLEAFLETAATSGRQQAYKQWRKGEGSSVWSIVWQIFWAAVEVAFIAYLLVSIDRGFPAVVVSLLILIYVNLSDQVAATGFMVFLNLAAAFENRDDTSEEARINTARTYSKQARGATVRKIALATCEVIAIVALIVKGLL